MDTGKEKASANVVYTTEVHIGADEHHTSWHIPLQELPQTQQFPVGIPSAQLGAFNACTANTNFAKEMTVVGCSPVPLFNQFRRTRKIDRMHPAHLEAPYAEE
jgi:hypothetical protein